MSHEYEGIMRIVYGPETCGATFVPVCPKCSRFVKADAKMQVNSGGEAKMEPNATCKKHGRVLMPFEGYI